MKLILILLALTSTAAASDVSWVFQPGYYTHRCGDRVAQYQPEKPSLIPIRPDYCEWHEDEEWQYSPHNWIYTYKTWTSGNTHENY
jgi:hypothetical protein